MESIALMFLFCRAVLYSRVRAQVRWRQYLLLSSPPSALLSLWDGTCHVLSGTKRLVKARVREGNKSWSLLTLSSIDQLWLLSGTCISNFSNTECTLWTWGGLSASPLFKMLCKCLWLYKAKWAHVLWCDLACSTSQVSDRGWDRTMCLHCVSSEQLRGETLTSSNSSIKIDSHRMAQVKSGADISASVAYMPYSVYVCIGYRIAQNLRCLAARILP